MKTTMKIAVIAMMGMSLGVNAQVSQTLSGGTPLYFTSTGTGTYDKTVLYHDKTNGFHLELAKLTNSNDSNPIDFNINTRGGNHPFFTIKGANGNVGIGTNTPSEKLDIKGNLKITGDLKMSGSDSYIWTNGTGTGYTGIWDQKNRRVLFYTSEKDGNVGIGTNTPSEKLDIKGNLKITGDLKMSGSDSYIWTNGTGTGYTGIWDQKNRRVLFYTSEKDGNVGIGTTNTKGFKLGVNGKVAATEVKVATYSNWADFVFKKDYHLPTLHDVENHIKEKGHLKDIPNAKEVEQNGFFLGEMDAKLLQKIEELTLYTIEQEKKLVIQQKEIEELKEQNSRIKDLEILVQKLLKEKN